MANADTILQIILLCIAAVTSWISFERKPNDVRIIIFMALSAPIIFYQYHIYTVPFIYALTFALVAPLIIRYFLQPKGERASGDKNWSQSKKALFILGVFLVLAVVFLTIGQWSVRKIVLWFLFRDVPPNIRDNLQNIY